MVFADTLEAALWADLPEAQLFPVTRPLLAHYTTVGTLEKMLLSNEVWLSNPLYMNDLEEMRFGMLTGAAEFRKHASLIAACRSEERHAWLIAYFEQLTRAFEGKHAFDTYVICLSKHDASDNDGVLSMWRGYGANGAGVALVFDASKLNADENSPFVLSRVQYATTADRLWWIDGSLKLVANKLNAVITPCHDPR